MADHFLVPLLDAHAPTRLVNASQGIVLATAVEPALDSTRRKRGLLGRDAFPVDAALILAPCNAVHMFGMRFPIDVLFLDRRGVVIKRALGLQRNRIAIAWRAFATIEFCANHPGVERTQVGDTLAIEPIADCGVGIVE
jgi:uncharacterized membrane protein (UPF0127 family)